MSLSPPLVSSIRHVSALVLPLTPCLLTCCRKFGKQIQKRQLEVPEYAASFVNYKALKKVRHSSRLAMLSCLFSDANLDSSSKNCRPLLFCCLKMTRLDSLSQSTPRPPSNPTRQLSSSSSNGSLKRSTHFIFKRKQRSVHDFIDRLSLVKLFQLKIRLKTLLDKKKVLRSRSNGVSRRSAKFTTLQEGFQQFANDLNKLQQFVEINGTAFSKILKKWDKTSKSKTKELYLARAVEVQPFFNATVISELSDQATTSLQELGAWADGDSVTFESRPDHIVSSQNLLGTDEGDADTLLLDTVLSGGIDQLRDLLGRMRTAADPNNGMDMSLMERVTRTFLAAINEGHLEALQVLISTGLVDIQSEDDINERNCLHQAAIYGNSFVLKYGLSKGVAVERTDVYGRTPLHYVSVHGRLDMIDALLAGNSLTLHEGGR